LRPSKEHPTTSPKQIIANRNNARQSTGPRSAPGKAIVAQNAVKHGLLAAHLLLPDESKIQLDEFRTVLRAQLSPVGPLESLLVERIISAAWRLRRLLRIETEMMTEHLQQKTPQWELASVFSNSAPAPSLGAALARKPARIDTYDKLRRYEAHLERGLFRALHELQTIQSTRKDPLTFTSPIDMNLTPGIRTAL